MDYETLPGELRQLFRPDDIIALVGHAVRFDVYVEFLVKVRESLDPIWLDEAYVQCLRESLVLEYWAMLGNGDNIIGNICPRVFQILDHTDTSMTPNRAGVLPGRYLVQWVGQSQRKDDTRWEIKSLVRGLAPWLACQFEMMRLKKCTCGAGCEYDSSMA